MPFPFPLFPLLGGRRSMAVTVPFNGILIISIVSLLIAFKERGIIQLRRSAVRPLKRVDTAKY